jgi:tetratricopeptide (TPR) repeat protein
LCHNALTSRGYAPQPLDSIDWTAARFNIRRWSADGNDVVPPIFSGNLEQLRALDEPEPGFYLLSLRLPRRDGLPVCDAAWVFIQPWSVAWFSTPDGRMEAPAWEQLFAGPPAQLTPLSALCLWKKGIVTYGAGPHNAHSFAVQAKTSLALPQGRYAMRVFHRGNIRVWRDNSVWFEKIAAKPGGEQWTFESDGRPMRIAVHACADPTLAVFLEPLDPRAAAMVNAELGHFHDLDVAIERQAVWVSRRWAQPVLFRNYALNLLRRGRFDEARALLDRAIRENPNDHENYYTRACLAAYRQDQETHRADAAEMFKRYASAAAPELRERAAKAAILIPDSGYDSAAIDALIDGALNDARGALIAWFTLTKGMIEYRAGRHESALDWLARSRQHFQYPVYQATSYYYAALALHRLGRDQEAKAAWGTASLLRDVKIPKPGQNDLGDIDNWLIVQVAHREAAQVFENPQSTTDRK